MRSNHPILKTARAAILGSLVLATPALASGRSDAWITTKAKIALLADGDVHGLDLNVDTVRGIVTLHGKVYTEAEKAKAAKLASGIDGVKSVRNLLQVVPEPQRESVEAADDKIEKDLKAALEANARLQESGIQVKSVNKGTVLLGGETKSMQNELEAMRVARQVAGVRSVQSEIQGPELIGEHELSYREGSGSSVRNEGEKAMDKVERGVDKTVDKASDLWIASEAKLRLIGADDVPALDINVDANDGVITLFGVVESEAAKQTAEREAAKVSGVKRVRNEIQVQAPKQAAGAKKAPLDDARLKENVQATLTKELEGSRIDVQVEKGRVRLTGNVASHIDKLHASVAARGVDGVVSVQNQLQVKADVSAQRAAKPRN